MSPEKLKILSEKLATDEETLMAIAYEVDCLDDEDYEEDPEFMKFWKEPTPRYFDFYSPHQRMYHRIKENALRFGGEVVRMKDGTYKKKYIDLKDLYWDGQEDSYSSSSFIGKIKEKK